ncbi:hypothetical protein [Knoellia subterranea]|uniref:Uncharacterized protein n=1 Tax=Knoellia subterranea KCTC 19937 TaxID=1385521 RepID=A0A0A0JJG8_9MICO|nr:hypothetical protein [Knoellia subterranea]KGN36919.1 hypothetical protein N803_16015 [Knoellia subterranea KCTC 19937]
MHHANHFYGHAAIMARWAGLSEAPAIRGYLQHGWNLHDGFAVGTAFAPGYPKFVWTEVVARRARAAGLNHVEVVSSPWHYLLLQEPEPESDQEESDTTREGTIVYPFHGWEGQLIQGSHDAYARELRETEGDAPITMCLYWNDFEHAPTREIYERHGFRVISHGRRGFMGVGHDTEFLYRQLGELRRHRRVVSNRLGSALFYGASVGAEIGVYGDPMVLGNDHAVLGGMAKQLRLFPELHQLAVPREVAERAAREELGLDITLSPAEVRETFGWVDED